MNRKSFVQIALPALAMLVSAGCASKSAPPPAMPPPNVVVVPVEQHDVPLFGNWVASLDGYVNANIQPQVSGYLVRQTYREGSLVRKGDVLFEIDPRPFQAALDQAKGQVAQARGQLGQAQAQLGLARINVGRDTPLAKAHAIAQSQLDNDVQTQKQNEALITANQAGIEAAQAAVENAELNLGFTKVRSLVDGIAGVAATQIGNLVSQTTILTTVSQVNPIKVYFPISEQEYLRIADKIKPHGSSNPLRTSDFLHLQLTLANNSIFQQPGRILFADRQVDTQTGTIRIAAAFANPGNILRPGQFARVKAQTALLHGAILIPQSAVTEMQGRYQVAVVGAGNKVQIRSVEPGDQVGTMWVITKGLSPGERVVSEGTSKVREGTPVNPTPQQGAAGSTDSSQSAGK